MLRNEDLHERCGLILTDGTIVEVKNIAEDTTLAYEMDPEEVLPYVQVGKVIGTWHTHPHEDPNLSGEDYSGFLAWPEWEHMIVGVREGQKLVLSYKIEDGLIVTCD